MYYYGYQVILSVDSAQMHLAVICMVVIFAERGREDMVGKNC